MRVRFAGGGPLDGADRDIDPSFTTYDYRVLVDWKGQAERAAPDDCPIVYTHRYQRAAVNEEPPTMALFRYVGMVDR